MIISFYLVKYIKVLRYSHPITEAFISYYTFSITVSTQKQNLSCPEDLIKVNDKSISYEKHFGHANTIILKSN
jgi:hypothetical protein